MNILENFIKLIGMNFGIVYSFLKIANIKNISILKTTFILLLTILITLFQSMFQIPFILKLISICLIFSLFLGKIAKTSFENAFIISIISNAISFIATIFSTILVVILAKILNSDYKNVTFIIIESFINFILVYFFYKFKKFKNGFPFSVNNRENPYLSIFIIVINVVIIFTYFLIAGFFNNDSIKYIVFSFIIFSILSIIVLQKTFSLYQKQKLQTQTLKDYENNLTEAKQKLETALAEKQNLIKSNHEFHHRQEALNKKIDDLAKQFSIKSNVEFSEEYGNIVERLNTLSDEYVSKTKSEISLPKTNIIEIDDMLSYMKSECEKNNIHFTLKVDCDVNYIIDNYISKSQLETLLGDLIRNAIIAVNHSSTDDKSIMVILGIKDDFYELCVFDTGIPFKAETLINLGLTPASTHLDEGGSGIGFITTFETIDCSNASFIITELSNQTFTKSLEIKFDNKHEYVISSDRKEVIESINSCDRDIVLIR